MDRRSKSVGVFLKRKREDANMTQTQVAICMRSSRSKVSRIESGDIHLDELFSYCDIIGINPMEVLIHMCSEDLHKFYMILE